jgi:hypothetical protein
MKQSQIESGIPQDSHEEHAPLGKFCVFCGKKPQKKNKEHIIPKWLLEMTGRPSRKAFFGFNFKQLVNLRENTSPVSFFRLYGYDSFVFPACEQCNSDHSDLETKAKAIVTKMLKYEPMSSKDFDMFLDWLDKVRVGLWLAFHYLDQNWRGIRPAFHIKSRLGMSDRFVIIYRTNITGKGVGFQGTDSPGFQHMPSCFALFINDLVFFNASQVFLCDRRLGFPFAKETSLTGKSGQIAADVVAGLERKLCPIIRRSFIKGGTELYQHIYRFFIPKPEFSDFYTTNYVRENSLESGRSKIFHQAANRITEYSSVANKRWIPPIVQDAKNLSLELAEVIQNYQLELFSNAGSTEDLPEQTKQHIRAVIADIRFWNRLLLKFQKDQIGKISELRWKQSE